MILRTGHVTYTGPDALDITRKGEHPIGLALAPEWSTIRPVLEAKRSARGTVPDDVWAEYVRRYEEEMRNSYRKWRDRWEVLLGYPEVTLCCYCHDPERCHRSLAADIVVKVARHRGTSVELVGETEPAKTDLHMLVVVAGEDASFDTTTAKVVEQAMGEAWGLVLTSGDHHPLVAATESCAMHAGSSIAGYSRDGSRYHWHARMEGATMRTRRWSSSGMCDQSSIVSAVASEATRGMSIGWDVQVLAFGKALPEPLKTLVYKGAKLHVGTWD